MTVTHIAAQDIVIGDQLLRQRCAWCGVLLLDYDLTRIAVPVGQEGPPGIWPAGSLVAVDGPMSWTVDGNQLPADACANA